jgi:hypothetical protein
MKKYIDVILDTGIGNQSPFHKNYIITNSLREGDGKIFLGNRNNKTCRFCGMDSTTTTFRNKAHIIPDFMGNKLFFSNYECDTCNDYIGNLEDSLSNFAGILNSLSTIKGKRSFPKFKDKKEGLEVFATDTNTVISNFENNENSDSIVHDKEANRMKFDINQPGYIPQDTFKSLVKIALLMMSEDEFQNYKETVEWINSVNKTNYENNPLFCVFRKIGGDKRFIHPWCVLLKKIPKVNLESYPHHTLLLFYGIITYQIFIPFNKHDKDLYKKNKIHLPLSEFVIKMKNKTKDSVDVGVDRIPLGSIDKVKSKKQKFSFGFKEKK